MAHGTIRRQVERHVIGVGRLVKIGRVTSRTLRRCSSIARRMAINTFYMLVPTSQGKKIMVHVLCAPARREDIVTLQTVGRKTRLLVVGACCGLIILEVATDAFIPDSVELQYGSRCMTMRTVQCLVYSRQRESIFNMYICDLVHQPIGRRMATGTIRPNRLLVYISVTSDTIRRCLRKYQAFVATPAIHRSMPALQCKNCFPMVKTDSIQPPNHACTSGYPGLIRIETLPIVRTDFPAIRGMAGSTIDFKGCAVRALSKQRRNKTEG